MRTEHLKALLWLLVISSWVLGVIEGRWHGGNEFFLEISKAVAVVGPEQLRSWWQPLGYFTLTVAAVFIFSQLFFGAGAAIFLFSRGVHDNILMTKFEAAVSDWTLTNIPVNEVWTVSIYVLILAVNLPLCLWSSQLGIQRSLYTFLRMKGRLVDPDFGAEPLSKFVIILAASLVVGLVGAFLFSYTKLI